MGILRITSEIERTATGVKADLSDGFSLRIDLLEHTQLRIAVVPDEGFEVDRTWMIAAGRDALDDGPLEGRDRLDLEGFSSPELTPTVDGFEGEHLAIRIERAPLRLTVSRREGSDWRTVLEERPNGAWQWFEKSHRLKHFQCLRNDEAHYGLGDTSGALDRTGRRIRVLQSDALGYDAEKSDPLYKHAPFVMVDGVHGCAGLLYDTMAECAFDLGAEHSNYFPRYRHVECLEKGTILYISVGDKVRDVVPQLHQLTGRIAMPPRWSLGFAFTSMHHADAPNAPDVITGFGREARQRGIPISAIHLGSGYTTKADGLRYVFNWNTKKFVDHNGFFADLKAMGYRTCANIKPVLLTGHDAFSQAADEGWFVQRANGDPAIEMFWGGQGAQLDFTNPAALDWWSDGVSNQVLGAGFDAAWNDNNEAELWDENAVLNGFGGSMNGMLSRPVHALLMTRSSYQASLAHRPDERPYSISRAGPIGIGRYGETWSGDNATSWHSLKWNLRQGLSMSLSGFPMTGHDIGGFVGPPPSPELLVRWFQMMALHPRCVMNSWKEDNIPNLPWMHEEAVDDVKAVLLLRYRFLPLLYSLIHNAHQSGEPVIAPTLFHFDDAACRADSDSFMLGANVLVAPVVNEGGENVSVYLPECDEGWVNFHSGKTYEGGKTVLAEAALSMLPLFIRAGSVLPLAEAWEDTAPHDATRVALTAFVGANPVNGQFNVFFDDGLSWAYRSGDCSLLDITLAWDGKQGDLSVSETKSGGGRPELIGTVAHCPQEALSTIWDL